MPPKIPVLPYLDLNFKLKAPSGLKDLGKAQDGIHQVVFPNGRHCLLLVHFEGKAASTLEEISNSDQGYGYTYGVMTIPVFSGWKETTEKEWKQIAVDLMKKDGAHPCLVKAIEQDWVDGTTGSWELISASSVQDKIRWSSVNCTLVGDAAHAMVPL